MGKFWEDSSKILSLLVALIIAELEAAIVGVGVGVLAAAAVVVGGVARWIVSLLLCGT